MPDPRHRRHPFTPQGLIGLGLIGLALVALSSCGDDEPAGPERDINAFCFPGPAPEESRWDAEIGQPEALIPASGTEAAWNRPAGIVTLSGPTVTVLIEVDDTVIAPSYGGSNCVLGLEDLVIVETLVDSSGTSWEGNDRLDQLIVTYLSDTAISGNGTFSIVSDDGSDGQLVVDFDAVAGCSSSGSRPDAGRYSIKPPLVGADTAMVGVTTRWNRSFRVIVLGEEPDSLHLPAWGMNMFVMEPVRRSGGKCVLTLTRAELVVSDQREGSPDEVNPRYFVFPTEDEEPTIQNDLLEVDFLNDAAISAKGTITMQRRTFSPTGGPEWHEKIDVEVDLDALKP